MFLTVVDWIVGVVSPATALQRMQIRQAIEILEQRNRLEQRSFEGAKRGRRVDGWMTASTSANAEIYNAGSLLRDRARDIVRNNPYGKKARRIFSDNLVGYGISPEANTGSKRLNAQIMAAWKDWMQNCDADGSYDFTGIQGLVARSLFESGECFVRFRDVPFDGYNVPFQVQVLESDFLDSTRNYELPNGGTIRQGIEFDARGKRVAYWMWPQHPGDNMLAWQKMQSVRIPASQILHIFDKDRPGQIRGIPAFAPVILRMKDLDDYDDAELWRKKIESCFAAFVVQNSGSEGPTLSNIASTTVNTNSSSTGTATERVEAFRPGMIEYLKPGEDVRFGSPTSDANYAAYSRVQLHAIAAGLGVTYEQLTGDLSQVNYSSLRAGLLEFRRMIETIRWQVFIPMLCTPIWNCFIERAYIAGFVGKIDKNVKWTPPKFEMIDPLKDAQADTMMMRNGTLTYREAVANQGRDPDEQLEEIAATNALLDAKGIIFDSDPRHTTQMGILQSAVNNQTNQGAPNNDNGTKANDGADAP